MIQKNDDMNKNTLTKMIFGAALLLLLAACSQDELADSNGTSLPEGKYPLQIGSVTLSAEVTDEPWGASHAPQTRVAENPDGNSSTWDWDGTEQIGVQLYADGDVATYTLNTDKTLTADNTLYWQNTQQTTVSAWYPTTETVSLADQSDKLSYVLKGSGAGTYNTPVTLNFTHALAKVRVVLTGDQADRVKDVKIGSFTSCTHTNGADIKGSGEQGWITMNKIDKGGGTKYWEANVVPEHEIASIKVNENESTLTKSLTPMAAKVNTITIDAVKAAMNPDELPDEINNNEEYTVSGTGTKGITIIGGTPTIIFKKDVTLTSGTAIEIKGGSPKLVFEGTTSLESTDDGKGAISLSGNASVNISGGGTLSLKANTADLYDGTWYEGAILGSAGGKACGSISISGVTLNIEANADNAAIGSGERGSSCGDIAITDATVRITGCAGGAGIGTSIADMGTSSCGDIRIKNSDIEITYGNNYAFQGAAIGCAGGGTSGSISANYSNTVKGIYITLKSGQSKSDFLGKLTTTSATGSDKVGQGYCEGKKYGTITNGVHWYNANGSEIK